MTRDEWKRFDEALWSKDGQLAMRGRCEEQGHDWENCCSMTFRIYQQCKWCGEQFT